MDVAELVAGVDPFDAVERSHQATALAWLASTPDIYRRVKPATPSPHLVSYVVLADPADWSVFLVDHRLAGLWLPAGGHVEPLEDPLTTARREAMEELGVDVPVTGPWFVTVTPTTGPDPHTDVSLWYVLAGDRSLPITLDSREFAGGRWWTPPEIAAASPSGFEPHFGRFLAKMRARLARAAAADRPGQHAHRLCGHIRAVGGVVRAVRAAGRPRTWHGCYRGRGERGPAQHLDRPRPLVATGPPVLPNLYRGELPRGHHGFAVAAARHRGRTA